MRRVGYFAILDEPTNLGLDLDLLIFCWICLEEKRCS